VQRNNISPLCNKIREKNRKNLIWSVKKFWPLPFPLNFTLYPNNPKTAVTWNIAAIWLQLYPAVTKDNSWCIPKKLTPTLLSSLKTPMYLLKKGLEITKSRSFDKSRISVLHQISNVNDHLRNSIQSFQFMNSQSNNTLPKLLQKPCLKN